MKCFSCGVDKDLTQKETYPHSDDKLDNEDPIIPLCCIECQPAERGTGYRMLVLCHDCWHRLEGDSGPDMWTAQRHYEELNPLVPFNMLPFAKPAVTCNVEDPAKIREDTRNGKWHPKSYNTVDWSKIPERVAT